MEVSMRVSAIEKERAQWKEQQYGHDQRLRLREQKLIQEKTELMREKEFLEKLRDQALCPGCMKSIHQIHALTSRSEGDGLDISIMSNTAEMSSKLHTINSVLPSEDAAYFQKESVYLDDLYYKHFNPKP